MQEWKCVLTKSDLVDVLHRILLKHAQMKACRPNDDGRVMGGTIKFCCNDFVNVLKVFGVSYPKRIEQWCKKA